MKNFRKQIALLLALCTVFTSITAGPLTAYAAENIREYGGDGYRIICEVVNEWQGGQQVSVTIVNTGSETIENWGLQADICGTVGNIWNASAQYDAKSGKTVIRNNQYNAQIPVDGQISFGYTQYGDSFCFSKEMILTQQKREVSEGYEICCNITNDWGTGFQGTLTIVNTKEEPIESWRLELRSSVELGSVWGAECAAQEERLVLTACGWNGVIAAGGSVTIGFTGVKEEDTEIRFSDYVLTEVVTYPKDGSTATPGGPEKPSEAPTEKPTEETTETPTEKPTVETTEPPTEETTLVFVEENIDMFLWADKKYIRLTETENPIYFTAELLNEVEEVYLINALDGQILGNMYDDGKLSEHADDIQGDSIYSCKVNFGLEDEGEIVVQVIGITGNKKYVSEQLKIPAIIPLTDEEMEDIYEADRCINDLIFSEEYMAADYEGRVELAKQLFYQLGTEGTQDRPYPLLQALVEWDEKKMYYKYNCGAEGTISLYPDEDFYYAMGAATGEEYIEEADSQDSIMQMQQQTKNAAAFRTYAPTNTADTEIMANILLLYNLQVDGEKDNKNQYQKTQAFIKDMQTDLLERGITLDVVYNAGLDDFEMINGYDIVMLAFHGSYTKGRHYMSVTDDDLDKDAYRDYFAMNLIKKNNGKYQIDPVIFKYFPDIDINNSAVFLSSCYGFGEHFWGDEELNIDHRTADIFLELGADVVFGYNNGVLQDYDFAMAYEMYRGLEAGFTIQECLEMAVEEIAASSIIWCRKIGSTNDEIEYVINGDGESIPFIWGNNSYRLCNEVLNGSFEDRTISKCWKKYGDVRRIANLGPIACKEGSHMAMITTGIGLLEREYYVNTESAICQRIYIDETVKTLKFEYNFVSEEPMEYVGDIYDDKFVVKISDISHTLTDTYDVASVNRSRWKTCPAVNFPGGDDTVYQTGWKIYSIDVSKYQGTRKEISFIVYDVGDSQYDSAVLIDNIMLR